MIGDDYVYVIKGLLVKEMHPKLGVLRSYAAPINNQFLVCCCQREVSKVIKMDTPWELI